MSGPGSISCRTNTQGLKIIEEDALPLIGHKKWYTFYGLFWIRTKTRKPRLTAFSLIWLLWDGKEPTLLFVKNRIRDVDPGS